MVPSNPGIQHFNLILKRLLYLVVSTTSPMVLGLSDSIPAFVILLFCLPSPSSMQVRRQKRTLLTSPLISTANYLRLWKFNIKLISRYRRNFLTDALLLYFCLHFLWLPEHYINMKIFLLNSDYACVNINK